MVLLANLKPQSIYLFLFRKNSNTAGWFGQGHAVRLIKYSDLGNYDNEPNKLGVGSVADKSVFQLLGGGGTMIDGSTAITLAGTNYIVVKYSFNATTTEVSAFINPDPTAVEPTPSFTNIHNQIFSFDGVYFAIGQNSTQADVDDLHVGDSWNVVTPGVAPLVALATAQITNAATISAAEGEIDLEYNVFPTNASIPITAK